MGACEQRCRRVCPGCDRSGPRHRLVRAARRLDVTRASISGFRAVPKRFAVAPRKPKAGAAKRGTEFRWRLSESAAVTIAIARALPGRRAGGACRRPTRRNRGNRPCTRYQGVGRLKAKGAVGAGSRAFSGRFGRRALSTGRYRAVIGAVDRRATSPSRAPRA